MRVLSITIGVWLVLITLQAEGAAVYTRIVDTATAIPGGNGSFLTLAGPSLSGNNIAFQGDGSSSQQGVYIVKGGVLSRIADRTTAVPGSPDRMQSFGGVSIDGSNAVFYNSRNPSTGGFVVGIYKSVGGVITRVKESADGGGFSGPVIVGSSVYVNYDGPGVGNESILTDSGGTLHALVNDGDPVPGGTGTFQIISCNVSAANGAVAFYGSSAARNGIYLWRNGQVLRIADNTLAAPGGTGNLRGFNNIYISFDGTDVAFQATDSANVTGLYRTRGAALVNIATRDTVVNGYGQLGFGNSSIYPVSLDAGHVAFSNGDAIFTDLDGSIQKLIGRGDTLFGKRISSVVLGTDGLSGDQIGFLARFNDGSSGIFVATVPLPAALPVGLSLGVFVLFRARLKCKSHRRVPREPRVRQALNDLIPLIWTRQASLK
jgi:hypothetical protein